MFFSRLYCVRELIEFEYFSFEQYLYSVYKDKYKSEYLC